MLRLLCLTVRMIVIVIGQLLHPCTALSITMYEKMNRQGADCSRFSGCNNRSLLYTWVRHLIHNFPVRSSHSLQVHIK